MQILLYSRVEHLTIPLPVFNLIYSELGEEIVVEMFRRLSSVRVLGGVGPVLWDLHYRWSPPIDGDDRTVFPSLCEIVLHRDYLPTILETGDDRWSSVSDGTSEEMEEGMEEGHGDCAITDLVPPRELFPESDSEDGSFVYESGHSDGSFKDSTGFPEQLKPPTDDPSKPWGVVPRTVPHYRDEYTDIREECTDNGEILQFCSDRPAVRRIIISNPAAEDDKDFGAFRMALREVVVSGFSKRSNSIIAVLFTYYHMFNGAPLASR